MAVRSVPAPLQSSPPLPIQAPPVYRVRPRPENANSIEHLSLSELRGKIRRNRVSFPSQVPIFAKHDRPDLQRKTVQLYFLFGWSCSRIAQRYGVLRQRIQQILSTWKRRAIQMGYIQEIPPAMPAREPGKLLQ
jgi:hypothetical protein